MAEDITGAVVFDPPALDGIVSVQGITAAITFDPPDMAANVSAQGITMAVVLTPPRVGAGDPETEDDVEVNIETPSAGDGLPWLSGKDEVIRGLQAQVLSATATLSPALALPERGDLVTFTTEPDHYFIADNRIIMAMRLQLTTYFVGIVQEYDEATGAVTLLVESVFAGDGPLTETIEWVLYYAGTAGISAAQIAFSVDTFALAPGQQAMTIQADKAFPAQGTAKLTAIEAPTDFAFVTVVTYSGTDIIVSMREGEIFGSGASHDAWALEFLDKAPAGIPATQMSGLRVANAPEMTPLPLPSGLSATATRLSLFSPNDSFVVTGGAPAQLWETNGALGEPETWTDAGAFSTVVNSPEGAAFTVAEDFIAFAVGSSPYIIAFDTATRTKLTDPGTLPTGPARAVSFSPDGALCAVAHETSPYVSIYDTTTSPWTKLSNPAVLPAGNAWGVSFSPSGDHLAVSHDSSPFITVYDTATWTKLSNPSPLPDDAGLSCQFSPNGEHLALVATPAFGGDPLRLHIYDFPSLSQIRVEDFDGSDASVQWHPSGDYLFVNSASSEPARVFWLSPLVTFIPVEFSADYPDSFNGNFSSNGDFLTFSTLATDEKRVFVARFSDPDRYLSVTAGSVQSYDGAVTLNNPTAKIIKTNLPYDEATGGAQVVSAALAGDVTSSGTTVNGASGTTFEADFGAGISGAFNEDWETQSEDIEGGPSVISIDGVTGQAVVEVVDDDELETAANLGASSSAYVRGGYAASVRQMLAIGFETTTGESDKIFLSSLTGDGETDVPSGIEHPRVFAEITFDADGKISAIDQPLAFNPTVTADQVSVDGAALPGLPSNVQAALAGLAGATLLDGGTLNSGTVKDVAIPAGYKAIIVAWNALSWAAASQQLYIQPSTDDGATYDTTAGNYNMIGVASGAATFSGGLPSFVQGGSQTAAQNSTGSCIIFAPGSTAPKLSLGQAVNSAGVNRGFLTTYVPTAPITNIRLTSPTPSTFDGAGAFAVYVI